MTEKRFTYGLRKETTQYEIQDSLHEFPFIEPFYYESHAKKVCNFLNELSDENGQLDTKCSQLKEENEKLKTELKGMEELLNSYRKTIKHDAELLADATKNGYLPPIKGGYFE